MAQQVTVAYPLKYKKMCQKTWNGFEARCMCFDNDMLEEIINSSKTLLVMINFFSTRNI